MKPHEWLRGWPIRVVSVALLAGLNYANCFSNSPALDDGWVIFDNPLIKRLENLPRVFKEPYNVAGASNLAGVFRPMAVGAAEATGAAAAVAAVASPADRAPTWPSHCRRAGCSRGVSDGEDGVAGECVMV